MEIRGMMLLWLSLLVACSAEPAKVMPEAPATTALSAQVGQTGNSQSWFQKESVVVHMVPQNVDPPKNYGIGTFVDDSLSWMRGSGELLRTRDGGRVWIGLKPAQTDEQFFGRLSQMSPGQLRFVNSRRGFFSSDKGIWKTIDGGDTWRAISQGGFTDLHFFDDLQRWMYLLINRGSRSYAQAHRTLDGGETWSPCGPIVDEDISDITASSENHDYLLHRTSFVNHDIGWAVATKAVQRNRTDGVLYTKDGGCNWELIWENKNGPIDPDESLGVQFVDQEHGWLVGGLVGGIYATSDGGRTWRVVANSAYVPPGEEIYFRNLKEGWLISTANQEAPMMRTANGGRTWMLLHPKDIASSDLPADWKPGRFLQMLSRSMLSQARK